MASTSLRMLAAGARDLDEDALHGVAVGLEVGQDVGRRLVEVRQVARVLVHVHVRPHRVLRRVERGHVAARRMRTPSATLISPMNEVSSGLAGACASHLDQRLGGGRGVAHGLRREDGEHAVAVGVVDEGLRRLGVARRRRRLRPRRPGCRGRRTTAARLELSSVSALSSASSPPRSSSRSAAITPGPPALVTMPSRGPRGLICAAERLAGVEQVFDLVDADDAGAAEGGAVERVVAGDGAGVAGGRQGGARRAPALDHDDRLGLGEVARRAHELARVGDGLDVQDDGAGVRVGAEVVDEVAEVDVAHGADADEGGEADLVGGRPVEDGGAQGARLAEEGDAAGRRDHVREGHVEVDRRADVAQAVGADDAHAVGLGDADDLLLELLALRRRSP